MQESSADTLEVCGHWAASVLQNFPLHQSESTKGSKRKTNARCRREGVEARICVRLAGARPDVVRSGCSVNSPYMCFGWVNSLTQHGGQTDFLLQHSL